MADSIAAVRAYHEATKHHPEAYAPGPGSLDWDTQPDPFRRYEGAPLTPLPLVEGAGRCPYDALYGPETRESATPGSDTLGLFLELSLGLSAWKSYGPDRWALRNNPSSGNLHPTEGYLLLLERVSGDLGPGLYHYRPFDHALERRAVLPDGLATDGAWGALGLASVVWREEWKYGARALRYCQHDAGHALACARFAARVVGWELQADLSPSDSTVAACLGIDRAEDRRDAEPEHPDLVAVLGGGTVAWDRIADALSGWTGTANALSPDHLFWPQIADALPMLDKPQGAPETADLPSPPAVAPAGGDACTLIRRRRSAQRMDGSSNIPRAAFERALARTLPGPGAAPFDALPAPPAINLILFVHAVDGLEPGLYALLRCRPEAFRAACTTPEFAWEPVAGTDLPLVRLLVPAELRRVASQVSCFQGIAGHGAFSLGMIADMAGVLERGGAWAYRLAHWEAGMIGQVLYLEAEAAGLQGTGIGCFFDDAVHRLLGLGEGPEAPWQTLYHFTVGGAIVDERLTTEPAYAHLEETRS